MVLAITAERDWKVVQLDVKTAFLFADIEKKVIVKRRLALRGRTRTAFNFS